MPTSPPAHRHRSKVSTSLALVIGLIAALIGFAPSAAAHHPEGWVKGECDTDTGQWNITWQAHSWSTGNPGTHTNVKVEYRHSSGGSWTEVPTGSPGVFNPDNDYKFGGSFVAPGSHNRVELKVTAVGQWGEPGKKIPRTGDESRTYSSWLKGKCDPPAEPEEGALKITKNVVGSVDADGNALSADLEFSITVNGPDGYTTNITLKAGETVTLEKLVPGNYTVVENEPSPRPKSIVVTPSGSVRVEDDQTSNVTVTNTYYDGATPSSELAITCFGVSGELRNNGDLATDFNVTYTLADGTKVTKTVSVAAKTTDGLPGVPTGTVVKVEVKAEGHKNSAEKDPAECYAAGEPSVELLCLDKKIIVAWEDDGELPSTYELTVDGVEVSITPGIGSFKHEIAVVEGNSYHIVVKIDGVEFLNKTIEVDCYQPGEPSVAVVCDVDGGAIEVSLVDDGVSKTSFTVTVDGANETGKGGETLTFPVSDGTYQVKVVGGGINFDESFKVDCYDPGTPEVDVHCDPKKSEIVVILVDDGDSPTEFTVVVGGETKTHSGPGELRFDVDEGKTYEVSVKGGAVDFTDSFEVDCYQTGVNYNRDCTGYEVTLTNPGEVPVTYTVSITINGVDTTTTHTVNPGDPAVEIDGTVPEGSAAHVTVTADDDSTLVDDAWTQRCAPPTTPPGDDPDPDPEFDVVVATAVCPTAAYLDFTVDSDSDDPVTITFANPAGDDIVRSGLDRSGRILLPGAEVAADGTVTAWPGWVQNDDGTWSVGGPYQWVLNGVTVHFEQGDNSAVRTVAYPVVDPAECGPDDSDVGGGGDEVDPEIGGIEEERPEPSGSSTLPRTGGSPLATGLVAFTLAIIGTALVAFERRGFQVVGQRRR